jgi:hypothetical protein
LLLLVVRNNISAMSTIVEASQHLFISGTRFKQLLADGVVTKRPPGEYVLDDVRREVLTHLRDVASARGASSTLSHERALLALTQRRVAELKLAVMAGKYISMEEAAIEIEGEYGVIRQQLLGLSAIAASLVGCDRADIEASINAKVSEILRELSSPEEIIDRVRPGDAASAGRESGGATAVRDEADGGSAPAGATDGG